MTNYAFVNLTDGTLNAEYPVGPLPYQIEAWDGESEILEDLDKTNSSLGFTGLGAFPIEYEPPSFDPDTQILQSDYQYTVNTDSKVVTATQNVRDLTVIELAANLAAAQAAKKQIVNDMRDQMMASGWTHDFGGTIGVHTLQTRDNDDRTNWLTSQATYSALVAAGLGDTVDAHFRDQDDQTFVLSYKDGLNTLLLMAGWGASIMQKSWDLKDAIVATTSLKDLDAIDITTGWPPNNVSS